ncbi:hypothetical protein I4U23_004977 [Adineta vaga]|nr:hypothetical protein I4U23_004977 [Adineta vaga]
MEFLNETDLLRGRCEDLPDVRSKIIRVFISSTFSDTLCERDSLIENVFPKLKDYCREKYGLEFQYSDMRWGIENEAADNHSEVETCLKEIELCQKYSVATNFVVLLSHRYGSRPTPAKIESTLFERLKKIVELDPNSTEDLQLLSQWYQLDTNSVPFSYILRSISSLLPNIKSDNTIEMKGARKQWNEINDRIRICLRQAAQKCFEQSQITSDEYDDFFISVTEKEILKGIVSSPNANQRTLCFFREIEDIYDHLTDKKASKFIDLTSTNDGKVLIDNEAESLLNRLKFIRIPNSLESNQIYSYKVPWTSNGINRTDHSDYINKFNEDFYNSIQQQIDHCLQTSLVNNLNVLQREILEHAIQCKTYVKKFHSRTDILDKLENYVKNDEEHRPCIVYGASGCGKTSVLAKTAIEAFNWWSDRSVSVILRFLGTTRTSSTIYKTFLSISEHICQLYHLTMQHYPDISQLRHQLETVLLPNIPSNEYLLILLDSIDQLETDSYDCHWLSTRFPTNVKCIVSTLPDHGNILSNLKILINYNPILPNETEHILVLVPPFDATTVDTVYNNWLQMKKRSLTDEQRIFIRELMSTTTNILPLYMKLIFDIISTWHSYDPIDYELKKLKNVDDCIRYLFRYLSKIHNELLFRRAICYMTSCRNGISQNELEDVLSLDDDVLKSVFQHYIPPIRRIPGILWTRIRNDLDEYITEKEVDDLSVIYWYHRRFIEVANSQYISKMNSEERKHVFQNVIDLYKETWKNKNKPMQIDNQHLVSKYNLNETCGEIQANRFTTSQPIEFVDVNGQIQFNKRKLNELPLFVAQLTSSLAIPIACEEIFFNYSFMRGRLRCSTFIDILNDLQKFKQSSSYKMPTDVLEMKKELDVFSSLFLIIGAQLQQYPENFPFEYSSRLLGLYGIKPQLTSLIKQFDKESIHHSSLIVPYCQIQPPGTGLLFSTVRHTSSIVDFDFTDDQINAITLSNRIVVLNMQSIETVLDIKLPIIDESYSNATTLTKTYYLDQNNEIFEHSSTNNEEAQYKSYLFLVNSLHHIYFISAHETIKFQRSSQLGFLIVEILDKKRSLCIIAEINGNTIDCWNLVQNRLFTKVHFPNSVIKQVLCVPMYSMIVTVLNDGTIHIHSIIDWKIESFVHRGTIHGGNHLHLVTHNDGILICTFDETISIDLSIISLKQFHQDEKILSDDEIIKTLICFNPPIESKPFKRIILPDKEIMDNKSGTTESILFFIIETNDSIYIIHKCNHSHISYVRIPGQFDIISSHIASRHMIYTSRGGIVDLYQWKCVSNDQMDHQYGLYVSIDISSSSITAIKSASTNALMFLCSMENGAIHAYYAKTARKSFQEMPSFPRTNQKIETIQLYGNKAFTLDHSKRELTTWSYQHSSSIESTHLFDKNIIIEQFVILSNKNNSDLPFVLILTNHHWIQIYSSHLLNQKPIFQFNLHTSSQIHSTTNGNIYILTNNSFIYSFGQKVLSNNSIEFYQINKIRLEFSCSMMFSTICRINENESLVILSDDMKSLIIYTIEKTISMNIDLSSYISSSIQLKSITSEQEGNYLFLYLNDKTLLLCEINIQKNALQLKSFDKIDRFVFKNTFLALYFNDKLQIHFYENYSNNSFQTIQLDDQCEHLYCNQTSKYLFVIIKPRILFMYRIKDNRQMAKLFVYDFVSFMNVDEDFVLLAMNDRRLLTLMIADPDDLTLQNRIEQLPSRNIQSINESEGKRIAEYMEKNVDLDSSDDDEEEGSKSKKDVNGIKNDILTQECITSICFVRFVTQLNGHYSISNMTNDEQIQSKVISIFENKEEIIDITEIENDCSNDDNDDIISTNIEQDVNTDLNDIHQKTLEYDQKQIKGIQFANAGVGNLKVINNHSVTSETCLIL